jgi:LPXTG-motif cell wall-anchored protein
MPKKVSKIALAALALAASAILAYGQTTSNSASTSTSATTSGKYRIALIEPVEGSSIAADQVRVVLTPNANAEGDENTQVDVFLDDQQKGTLKPNETEFRVAGVKPGPHKLVLIARNPVSDAQFDRREINFVATGIGDKTTGVSSVSENAFGAHVPPAVSSTERQHSYTAKDGSTSSTQVAENQTTTGSTSSSSTTGSASTYSTNPPATTGSSSSSSSNSSSNYSNATPQSTAPAPATGSSSSAYSNRTYSNSPNASSQTGSMSTSPSSGSSSSTRSMGGTDNARLPKTGTSEGLLAIAGAALLATGALMRRRSA